jgi:hypothetical protein
VSVFALALGAIGGIPQIRRWFKPKPRLRITRAQIEERPAMIGHVLQIEVRNKRQWWGRNRDAVDVVAGWYIMDKNFEQWSGTYNQILAPYLMAGAKVSKQFSGADRFNLEGNPYTIAILVSCREGAIVRKKLIYESHSEN